MNKIILLSISILSFSCFAEANQKTQTNSVTGAKTWSTQAHGVYFSLTQILPEQARAFYVNRGFSLKQIEPYATSCVYMTVLRNDKAAGTIHFISNNWTLLVNAKSQALVPVNEWLTRLKKDSAKKSALIAFRWAQFPPEQEYEPGGDWNQGMLSMGLAANKKFDIVARWDIAGKQVETTLKGVRCAK